MRKDDQRSLALLGCRINSPNVSCTNLIILPYNCHIRAGLHRLYRFIQRTQCHSQTDTQPSPAHLHPQIKPWDQNKTLDKVTIRLTRSISLISPDLLSEDCGRGLSLSLSDVWRQQRTSIYYFFLSCLSERRKHYHLFRILKLNLTPEFPSDGNKNQLYCNL